MKKKQAILIFGKTQVDLAKALGKTKSAISQWGEDLTPDQVRLVVGEAYLQKRPIPININRSGADERACP